MCTKQKYALNKKPNKIAYINIYIYEFMLSPEIYLISETRKFFT